MSRSTVVRYGCSGVKVCVTVPWISFFWASMRQLGLDVRDVDLADPPGLAGRVRAWRTAAAPVTLRRPEALLGRQRSSAERR